MDNFRPCPKPGRDRIKNPRLLTFIKETVNRCEWPNGCLSNGPFAAHHIYGRGSGGGKRDDHPECVAILCHPHHNLGPENAHDARWWNAEGQKRIQEHIMNSRGSEVWFVLLERAGRR